MEESATMKRLKVARVSLFSFFIKTKNALAGVNSRVLHSRDATASLCVSMMKSWKQVQCVVCIETMKKTRVGKEESSCCE